MGKGACFLEWEEVAYDLLTARPNDVVKLACSLAEGGAADLDALDLRALSGLEIKPGGVRVEIVDKAALLEVAVKAGWISDADPEAAATFFAALESAATSEAD